jgi:hypothetical protein
MEGRSRLFGAQMLINESENGYLAMEATVLVEAFEDTVKVLGLIDRDDPVRLAVARHIIIFAKAGERDSVRLHEHTLKAVRLERRQALAPARASIPAGP